MKIPIGILLLLCCGISWGEDLAIGPDDLRIDIGVESGYHLKIRKKPGLGSVLLTESTEDPQKKLDTFAYRSPVYTGINGDEERILNGKVLKPGPGRYFLVDSTPEPDPDFGESFHIFVPYVINYGYPWSREGEVQVLDGTYFSLRAFSKPFADYTGAFRDNPFVLRLTQRPLPGPPEENFMPETVEEFTKIADEGEVIRTPGQEDMLTQIERIVGKQKGRSLDLVLALDTTQSMEDDIPYLQKLLVPMLEKRIGGFDEFRIGLVLYRDYMEEYLTRTIPFTTSLSVLQKAVDRIRIAGGRDIPEAVHEALWTSIHSFKWKAENRIIILIGDAPPHPRPRGTITEASVKKDAEEMGIVLYTIILPQ